MGKWKEKRRSYRIQYRKRIHECKWNQRYWKIRIVNLRKWIIWVDIKKWKSDSLNWLKERINNKWNRYEV